MSNLFSKEFILKIVIPIIVIAILAFLVDRITKEVILLYFSLHTDTLIVTSFLNLELIYNYGISFSFLHGLNSYVITLISTLALLFLIIIFYRIFDFSKFYIKLSIGFIIGATIGNIYDRLIFGGVIDFIYLHYKSYGFPIFNSADIFITFSAILLLLKLLSDKKTKI